MKRNIIRDIYFKFTVLHPLPDCVVQAIILELDLHHNITFCLISVASIGQISPSLHQFHAPYAASRPILTFGTQHLGFLIPFSGVV